MDTAARAAMDELAVAFNNTRLLQGLSGTEVMGMGIEFYSHAAVHGDLVPFTKLVDSYPLTPPETENDIVKAFFSSRNKRGYTLLHMAAMGGKTNVIEYLLEKGRVDIDIKDSRYGDTALHISVMLNQYSTACYLLGKGASPNAESQRRRTPLHHAVRYGSKDFILLLISKGADINSVSDWGTPLQVAAMEEKKDFMKVLLENHANPNVMSYDLMTPLITSIATRSHECMKLLLKEGADPNIRGSKGMTCLGWAASMGNSEDIKCLLNAGADPDITDNLGMTPLEVASLEGNHQIAMVLFPVTTPIPKIPEWSIDEVARHVQSEEAREERTRKMKENVLLFIAKGADSLKREDYFEAAQYYTEAIRYDPRNEIPLSKRSLCFAHMNEGDLAMLDARYCLSLNPRWHEAYLRIGEAWMVMKEFDKAISAFQHGLMLDYNNEEIGSAFRKALEAQQDQFAWVFGPKPIDALNR